MKIPKFNIGEKVYHITIESKIGIVINSIYNTLYDQWEYVVTFSPEVASLTYLEHELTKNRNYE